MFETQPLQSVVDHQVGGGTPSRSDPSFWGGRIPWASVKDFSDDSLEIEQTQETITEAGLRASTANVVPPGVPLVCTRMAVGRVAIAKRATAINQDVRALFPKSQTDSRYLLRLLSSVQQRAESQAVGSTVKGIRTADYLALEVPVAPVGEQSVIAQILDTLDTQIRQTEALIAKLETVKQGLLTALFTRGIDENGQLRPPPEEIPELYKGSPLGLIPKDWKTADIAALLSDKDPSMRSGPFGSSLLKSELVESGIPLLGIDNVQVECFRAEFSRYVLREKFLELSRYAVRPNDLMITIMGTVGRCCLVPDDIGDALSSKHTWAITLNPEKYVPYLAMLQVNYAPWVLKQLAQDEQGGIMSAIRSETLRSLRLPVPPIAEQRVIADRLKVIGDRLEAERLSVSKLQLAKRGLMNDLLTGRVRATQLLGTTKTSETTRA